MQPKEQTRPENLVSKFDDWKPHRVRGGVGYSPTQVLGLLAAGRTAREVSDELGLPYSRVRKIRRDAEPAVNPYAELVNLLSVSLVRKLLWEAHGRPADPAHTAELLAAIETSTAALGVLRDSLTSRAVAA